jgi:hypothetical protein
LRHSFTEFFTELLLFRYSIDELSKRLSQHEIIQEMVQNCDEQSPCDHRGADHGDPAKLALTLTDAGY